jgi:formylglycine-generating enzyme required for sulfatase activity
MSSHLQSILETEGLTDLLSLFTEQEITDSVLTDLSDSDLKELGIDKMGVRKRLLAAFGQKASSQSIEVTSAEPSQASASSPADATKECPFINSLGMPFVPIPRFETCFCVWPVRVQDYEQYCAATGATYPPCPFPQGSDHPVVGVTWNDAIEFCVWLTRKERAEGRIDDKTVYRLPTDLEWSAAVGLPYEPEPTPEERHLKAPDYPWGLRWPPPENAGNYEHHRDGDYPGFLRFYEDMLSDGDPQASILKTFYEEWKTEWSIVDNYQYTSPVGSFCPNSNNIYDLGGNVWEWCMDSVTKYSHEHHIKRGGSFALPDNEEVDSRRSKLQHLGKSSNYLIYPIQNSLMYKSSFRLVKRGTIPYEDNSSCYINNNRDKIIPDVGIRVVICKS